MKRIVHQARKRFGQHFLVDQQIISDIICSIHPQPEDHIIEIGPGLGALTIPLTQTLNHISVIEIDRNIVEKLYNNFPQDKLTVYASDALKFDYSILGKDLRLIGNLPYNISTPLLFHLSHFLPLIRDMHFMLQKEVVDRMVARPSTHSYGRLSVMLQYRFEMDLLFTVPAEAFRPAPKVESAIVRMQPIKQPAPIVTNEALFSHIVTAAFLQRRKTLRNSLSGYVTEEDYHLTGIDPQLRAENLSVEQFIQLANYLAEKSQDTV